MNNISARGSTNKTAVLAEILDHLSLSRSDALALDIGGAAFSGKESTVHLAQALERPVHVLASARAEANDLMKAKFGSRVEMLPDLKASSANVYDVVVVNVPPHAVVSNLQAVPRKFLHLVKPRGYFVTRGLQPGKLGLPDYEQPEAGVAQLFRECFAPNGDFVLPPWLDDHFELVMNIPRSETDKTALSWLVLQRRQRSRSRNTLPEVLDRLQLSRSDALALDIGGAAFSGKESTVHLAQALERPVHVLASARAEANDLMKAKFGSRVEMLPDLEASSANVYDVVVVNVSPHAVVSNLQAVPRKFLHLVKPRGYFVTRGLQPGKLGLPDYEQPEAGVAQLFRECFAPNGDFVLPPWLDDHFELVMNIPRSETDKTALSWLVLQRRQRSRSRNTLPEVLDRLQLSRSDALALDIGGAAFSGKESTVHLAQALERPVHVLASARAEANDLMKAKFGSRVEMLPDLEASSANVYDVVVVNVSPHAVVSNLQAVPRKFLHLVKPRGYFVTRGLQPGKLGLPDYEQPEAGVAQLFRECFAPNGDFVLPPWLDDHFELVMNIPRSETDKTALSWLVLQRRTLGEIIARKLERSLGQLLPQARQAEFSELLSELCSCDSKPGSEDAEHRKIWGKLSTREMAEWLHDLVSVADTVNAQCRAIEVVGDMDAIGHDSIKYYWLAYGIAPSPAKATKLAQKMFKKGDIQNAKLLMSFGQEGVRTMMAAELKLSVRLARELQEDDLISRNSSPKPFSAQKRKIGYVASSAQPWQITGYTIRTHELLRALASEIDIQCFLRPGYPADRIDVTKTGLDPAEKIVFDGVTYNYSLIEGVKHWGDEFVRKMTLALVGQFTRAGITIVHAASNNRTALPALRAARELGLPFIYEVRGLWELTAASRNPSWDSSDRYMLDHNLERFIAREADHVFTITSGVANELTESGVLAERISLLPNAVDPMVFSPLPCARDLFEEYNLATYDLVLVYAGSIVKYEGLDDLIDAISLLRDRGLRCRLLVIGAGIALSELEQQVLKLALTREVSFLGQKQPESVRAHLNLATVIALPRKAFRVCEIVSPLKPFEAMALAKPVILSNLAASRDIVADNETGLLCKPEDPVDLANKLEQLARDGNLRQRLGEAARKWILEGHSWKANVERALAVYARLGDARRALSED